jgi:hypothetical protein
MSWLVIDSVVLRTALGLGHAVAIGPERGVCGGLPVPHDLVHRRTDRGGL